METRQREKPYEQSECSPLSFKAIKETTNGDAQRQMLQEGFQHARCTVGTGLWLTSLRAWTSQGRLSSPLHLSAQLAESPQTVPCAATGSCHNTTRHDQGRQQEPRSCQPFNQSVENQIQIKKLDTRITKLGRDVFIPVEDDCCFKVS